jgi:hypothetical protein
MFARIFRPAKTAMQSGRGNSQAWVLEFVPTSARIPDPLMGWSSSNDMNAQIRLNFTSLSEATDYAQRHGIAFRVMNEEEPKRILKAYADNFSTYRRQSWTH